MQHMTPTNNIKHEGGTCIARGGNELLESGINITRAAHSVMDGGPHTNACLLRMRCDDG